ncbi:MAG TPA: type II secretion system protein GspM [Stellaceae bacterium]|nr:type II secretion system protein GspM [Stellaceae bacterium]
MTTLPRRLNRAMAILLLAGAIALPVVAVMVPLGADYAATRARIAQTSLALGRYRQAAERLPQQRTALTALEQREDHADGFLAGGNETLIGAELQNRIKTVVEAARGELRSTQVLPPRDEDGFRQIAVRAEMTGDLASVQAILYRLETASPTLFLDNIDLRVHPTDHRDGSDDVPPLDANFTVYGYVRARR